MNSPQDAANLRTTGLLLLFCFSAALILVGLLLIKTRMWDRNRGGKAERRDFSGSVVAGRALVLAGAILAFVSIMFFIVNNAGLL